MMTESEFIRLSEELFEHIEDQIDENGWDFDCQFAGNVLTIEAENGTQIIVNRHTPNQELWIAAKSGGLPFRRTKRQMAGNTRRTGFLRCFERSTECGFGRSSQYCRIVIESLNLTR